MRGVPAANATATVPGMDLSDASNRPPVTDAATAGAILRPAFLLLLLNCGLAGGFSLLQALGNAWSETGVAIGYFAVTIASYCLIGAFAWRDRAACRVFVRPRRGMVELCVIVGIVGAMSIAMVEDHMHPGTDDPVPYECDLHWPLMPCLISSALLPAVFEELMFRGVIQQRLCAVLSWPLGIAVQALMFSFVHMDGSRMVLLFAFGCLAGFLQKAARALWPCMLMHLLWNGNVVLRVFGVL